MAQERQLSKNDRTNAAPSKVRRRRCRAASEQQSRATGHPPRAQQPNTTHLACPPALPPTTTTKHAPRWPPGTPPAPALLPAAPAQTRPLRRTHSLQGNKVQAPQNRSWIPAAKSWHGLAAAGGKGAAVCAAGGAHARSRAAHQSAARGLAPPRTSLCPSCTICRCLRIGERGAEAEAPIAKAGHGRADASSLRVSSVAASTGAEPHRQGALGKVQYACTCQASHLSGRRR